MKILRNLLLVSTLAIQSLNAQTNLVNFDFNSYTGFPTSPVYTATGINCTATSAEAFASQVGIATTSRAFMENTTGGKALRFNNQSGTTDKTVIFQLGGSDLYKYESYALYFQVGRNEAGPTAFVLSTSTDGTNYTTYNTYDLTTTVVEWVIDLSSQSFLNGASALYIKINATDPMTSGGKFVIDNFQVRGSAVNSGGSNSSGWQVSSSNITTTKNMGIGTLSPAFPLDVNGEARITSNFQVGGTTTLAGDISATSKLNVTGNATFQSNLLASSIDIGTAGNSSRLSSIALGEGRLIYFGPISNQPSNFLCIPTFVGTNNIAPNRITIPPSSSTNVINQFDFRNDGVSSFIEYAHNSSGEPPIAQMRQGTPVTATTWPTIKVASVCQTNVELGFGGGFVSTGKNLEVGFPARSYAIACNIYAGPTRIGQRVTTEALNTTSYGPYYNTQLFVDQDHTRALSVFNTKVVESGTELFVVYGDGRTAIGDVYVPSGYMMAVKGKIIAEEVVVQLRTNWPDYVFKPNYKLMPLNEVEKYILLHKHLPNIPTAGEVSEQGISTGDMLSKQMEKIEELTIYLIEQQKQIEALKSEIELLKK